MVHRDAVLEAIGRVMDPCSIGMGRPLDIASFGLVENIQIERETVTVSLILTDPTCFFFQDLKAHIKDVLLELDGVDQVRVELVTHTLWSPERMKNSTAPSRPVRLAGLTEASP